MRFFVLHSTEILIELEKNLKDNIIKLFAHQSDCSSCRVCWIQLNFYGSGAIGQM